jgi:hypothetical protein
MYSPFNEYIDTRGPWPLYIIGCVGYLLRGAPKTVTVEEAREWVRAEQR